MNNNKTKNIILAVLVVGLVGMTIAYASLTQQLTINNNQVTVSSNWRVRFNSSPSATAGGSATVTAQPSTSNDDQTLGGLRASFSKPGDSVTVNFTVENQGNIAARGENPAITQGTLSCSTTDTMDSSALQTFCQKLTISVTHSDGTTWTQNDTLAAYSGTGSYPSIAGKVVISMPSTLDEDDLSVINGKTITVSLSDTELHFTQY